MQLRILYTLGVLCFATSTYSQEVLASAGDSNFTIGETVIYSSSSSSSKLTQGFHQPFIGVVNITEHPSISINIFPNPTQGFVQIEPQGDIKANVLLFDSRGRVLVDKEIRGVSSVDLTSYQQGEYSIIIKNEIGVLKTVKILLQR